MQFGRYREAKTLIDEGMQKHLLLQPSGSRILTDFTGEGYRLIIELPYATLADYETDLKKELGGTGWKDWYEKIQSPDTLFGKRNNEAGNVIIHWFGRLSYRR